MASVFILMHSISLCLCDSSSAWIRNINRIPRCSWAQHVISVYVICVWILHFLPCWFPDQIPAGTGTLQHLTSLVHGPNTVGAPHAVCPPSWCSPTSIQQALHIHSLSHALSLSRRAMQSSTPTHPHPHPPHLCTGQWCLQAQTCFHKQHRCELLPDTKAPPRDTRSRGHHPFPNDIQLLRLRRLSGLI